MICPVIIASVAKPNSSATSHQNATGNGVWWLVRALIESIIKRVTVSIARGTRAATNRHETLHDTTTGAESHTIFKTGGMLLRALMRICQSLRVWLWISNVGLLMSLECPDHSNFEAPASFVGVRGGNS